MNGTNSILSSDCYKLSFEILEKTNKRVSETTLKRFFGFTSCAHNPSQYTLNAICNYCDYPNWEEFKQEVDKEITAKTTNRQWKELKLQLTERTVSTIALEKRKISNWDLGIHDIALLTELMDKFHQGPKNLLMIHATANAGKTEKVARWVEKALQSRTHNMVLYLDDLSVFESAVYGYHARRWLANILDFPTESLLSDFLNQYQTYPPGSINILIDGFNEEILSENHYYAVLQNLLELIAELEEYPYVKFTLILRTHIYEKLKRKTPKTLITNWHQHQVSDKDGLFNYTTKEISQLLFNHQIEHSLARIASSVNVEWMAMPRFFHWFIHQKKAGLFEDLGDDMLQHLYIHDLFTKNPKLFKAMEQTNRSLLLEFILSIPCADELTCSECRMTLSKSKILTFQGLDLYHELVGFGAIVYEENASRQIGYRFPQYKAYLFAYYLYHILGLKDEDAFVQQLDRYMEKFPLLGRLTVTNFILFNMEDIGQSDTHIDIYGFGNRSSLGHILRSMATFSHWFYLQGSADFREEVRRNIIESRLVSDLLFKANLPYKKVKYSLLHILSLELDPVQEYQLRLKLATFALLKWDEDELINQLELLAQLHKKHAFTWSVDGVEGIALLYHFIRYEKINTADIKQIIHANYLDVADSSPNEDIYTFEFVGYLTIILSQDPILAQKYLPTIDYKIQLLEQEDRMAFIIYYYLRELIRIRATGELPQLPDPIHTSFINAPETYEDAGFLFVFAQILALHFELATQADEAKRQLSSEIERRLKPMGYEVLIKHFEIFFYANGTAPPKAIH